MRLDVDFVLYASIVIACLIPLYIYRKKVFSSVLKKNDISLFIRDIKKHMQVEHPKIKIDYAIIDKTKDENNIEVRQTIIVEDIVSQFFYYEYEKKTQSDIQREKHWQGYEERSISNDKYPNDWPIRKDFAWKRDNGSCNRCGTKIQLEDAITVFVKDIKDGGGYNFENIIILCSDCNKTINSQNPKNSISSLQLNEKLMIYVQG
jgi:hypothetical protein